MKYIILLLLASTAGSLYKWHESKATEKANTQTIIDLQNQVNHYKDTEIQRKQDLIDAQDKANEVSADYEQIKATQQVKIQTIRDTVQKIVERPVYRNVCLDSDGLQQLGKAINLGQTKLSRELDDTVPKPDNSE